MGDLAFSQLVLVILVCIDLLASIPTGRARG
jgi:hypothetical protein